MDFRLQMQILRKFDALNGKVLEKTKGFLIHAPEDEYVDEQHTLHSVQRGLYKPRGEQFLLSYRATEKEDNYGEQIIWQDKDRGVWEKILLQPPTKENDANKKKDIEAARYNLRRQLPLGIIERMPNGKNRILGLGMIVEEVGREGERGHHFIIYPHQLDEIIGTTSSSPLREQIKTLTPRYETCLLCDVPYQHLQPYYLKSWEDSTPEERLDPNNQIHLCPTHGYLYEKGLIQIQSNGTLFVKNDPYVYSQMKETFDESILMEKQKEYLT